MNVRTIFPEEIIEPRKSFFEEKSVSGLIESIYYDSDWWQKNIATEWWQRDGHFNESLYGDVLRTRLNLINCSNYEVNWANLIYIIFFTKIKRKWKKKISRSYAFGKV